MDELKHYGKKGMHWGVITTSKPSHSESKRFAKVSRSKWRQRRDTRTAIKIISKSRKRSENLERKTVEKILRLSTKNAEKTAKRMASLQSEKEWLHNNTAMLNTKLTAINSGTVKAGRDFVVNTKKSVPIPVMKPGIFGPRPGLYVHKKKYVVFKE